MKLGKNLLKYGSCEQNDNDKMRKFNENHFLLRQFSKELYKDAWHEKLDPETQILF